MKTFNEWHETKLKIENAEIMSALYDARESIKNALAQLHFQPQGLWTTLQMAKEKVGNIRPLRAIIDNMENYTARFIQEIKNKSLAIDGRVNNMNDPKNREENEIYQKYAPALYNLWQGFDKFIQQPS